MECVDFFKLLYKEFEALCFKPIQLMDRQITMYLEQAEVETRPANGNGIWSPLLLPLIMLAYCWTEQVSMLYKITTFISIGLLCYCLLFLLFLSTSSVVVREPVYGGCLASSLIATIAMYTVLRQGLIFSLSVTLPSTILFAWLLRLSITELHKTFTIGEAMIVCQSVVLFLMMSLIKFFFEMPGDDEEMDFINNIVYTVLSTVGLIVAALYLLKDAQRNIKVLSYIVLSAVGFALLMLYSLLGNDFSHQLYSFILEKNRIQIITFWLILVVLAVCALLVRTKLAVKATTVTRKTFHVLASLVFMSGILFDIYLMYLAAGVGLAVLVFVEALRKSGIEPISSALQSAFLVYCDEKDCGTFAMSPLYLYTGLACPLLLVRGECAPLERLAGVLAVGVGDAAASWYGSTYGLLHWPDSHRTLEGTLFNVLSQIVTVYVLTLFRLVSVERAVLRASVAGAAAALVEARTSQVDNLVLPLVTLLAYRAAWPL